MEDKQRQGTRSERDQLLTLLNGWDPAGVLKEGGPRDRYAFLSDKLLDLLSRNAGKEELTAFLETEVNDHFGAPPRDASQFAVKLLAWYEMLE